MLFSRRTIIIHPLSLIPKKSIVSRSVLPSGSRLPRICQAIFFIVRDVAQLEGAGQYVWIVLIIAAMLNDRVFGNFVLVIKGSVEVLHADPVHILHVNRVLLVPVATCVMHHGLVAEAVLVQLSVLVDTRTTLIGHDHLVFLDPLVESLTAALIVEQCAISVDLDIELLL